MDINKMNIRKARVEDADKMYQLIEELAIYHNVDLKELNNTPEQFRQDGFGEDAFFRAFVVELEGDIIATAIYYYTYSTWKGKTLYLEDLIVNRKFRGLGIGKMLFNALAKEAESLNAAKLKWQVAEDNQRAIRFYEALDADFDEEWINCQLNKRQIANLLDADEVVA